MKFSLQNRNTVLLLIAAGLLILSGLGYVAYKAYHRLNVVAADPLDAIPGDAVLVLKFNDPQSLWADKLKGSRLLELFSSDTASAQAVKDLMFLDSALESHSISLDYKAGEALWASMHEVDSGLAFLFIASPTHHGGLTNLPAFLKSLNPIDADGKIKVLKSRNNTSSLFYTLRKGLFIASFNKTLIQQSIEQLYSGVRADLIVEKGNLRSLSGKNVDANLFLGNKAISLINSRYMREGLSDIAPSLENLAFSMELDLDFGSMDLSGAGYSIPGSNSNELLSTFDVTGELRIDKLIPSNTKGFIVLSPGDFERWYARFSPTSKYSLENDPVLSWVDGEMAQISIAATKGTHSIVALRAENIEVCRNRLMGLLNESNLGKQDSILYRNYFMGQIHGADPLAARFGKLFSSGADPWFTLLEDYAFFSSSQVALQRLIDDYLGATTLESTEEYKGFQANINRKSNILIYVDGRRSSGLEKGIVPMVFSHGVMAVQWVWDEGKYFSNFCFRTMTEAVPVSKPRSWQFEMEDELAWGPFILETHKDQNQRVMAMDRSRNIYFIDGKGRLIWKRKMTEALFGNVTSVDLLKNGRIQYLMNSATMIYIIDANGNDVTAYPKRLKVASMNPVAVFDYDRTQDYRLLYCGRDRKIYNLNIDCTPVKGFAPFAVKDSVHELIQHLRMNENDVIAARDKAGDAYFLDRKGSVRIIPKRNVKWSGPLWVDQSQPRYRLVGKDTEGRQIFLSQAGDVIIPANDQRIANPAESVAGMSMNKLPDRFPSLNLSVTFGVIKTENQSVSYLVSSDGRWIITFPL